MTPLTHFGQETEKSDMLIHVFFPWHRKYYMKCRSLNMCNTPVYRREVWMCRISFHSFFFSFPVFPVKDCRWPEPSQCTHWVRGKVTRLSDSYHTVNKYILTFTSVFNFSNLPNLHLQDWSAWLSETSGF